MGDSADGFFLSEAMQAPDDVSEVRDDEGRMARIERDPSYPGAKRVYLDERFTHGFDELLRQSFEAGWVEGPTEEHHTVVVRSASLRKDDRKRVLVLTATFGMGALMLIEERAS